MSTLTQFTVTGKEKDDFYGFHIGSISNQTIKRTVTKDVSGVNQNDSIYEYALPSAYDIANMTLTTTTSLVRRGSENTNQSGKSNIKGIAFNSAGTKMYAVDSVHARIIQYSLSTAFNVSTLTYTQGEELNVKTQDITPQSLTFNDDGSKMYMLGRANDKVYEYALSTGFDISTASYTNNLN